MPGGTGCERIGGAPALPTAIKRAADEAQAGVVEVVAVEFVDHSAQPAAAHETG